MSIKVSPTETFDLLVHSGCEPQALIFAVAARAGVPADGFFLTDSDERSSAVVPPGDAMFADIPILAPADEHTGNALLCFLSTDTFVGFVELEHEGQRHVLKLTGSESLTECDRALCAVQDCCGDTS